MLRASVDEVRMNLASRIPEQLVNELLEAHQKVKHNFLLERHEPAELNAGKFCEVVLRILQQEAYGSYTPMDKEVKNLAEEFRKFENATTAIDSVRFHIPRVASAVYNIRNRRGVGHAGGDVSPNLADASLVAAASDWILAELVRICYKCTLEDAQKLVNDLVQRRLPLVHLVGGKKRVLNPALTFKQRVLILLTEAQPSNVSDRILFDWTEHSNFSVFKRDVLRRLHAAKQIEYSGSVCTILPPGLRVVEKNYSEWAEYQPTE
jgi:hypothetical protein